MIILDNDALEFLNKNIKENLIHYQSEIVPWIHNAVEGFDDSVTVQDDTLIISDDASFDTENAIRFFEKKMNLSTTLASSNNYWTTLAHTKYYQYMKTRWPIVENTKENYIKTRYFFNVNNIKSRARHGLTRLWWIAYLTYDKSNKIDPYYYTRLATIDQELFNLIMETRHLAQNKKALFAMLDTITTVFKWVKEGRLKRFNKRNFFRNTMQEINLIGSITVWNMLTKDEAEEKLNDFAKDYFEISDDTIVGMF